MVGKKGSQELGEKPDQTEKRDPHVSWGTTL